MEKTLEGCSTPAKVLSCFVMLIEDRWFEGGVKEAIYRMFTWKNTRRGRPLSPPSCHSAAALKTVGSTVQAPFSDLDLISGELNKPHMAGRGKKSEPTSRGSAG